MAFLEGSTISDHETEKKLNLVKYQVTFRVWKIYINVTHRKHFRGDSFFEPLLELTSRG